jgi:hypothetical protein
MGLDMANAAFDLDELFAEVRERTTTTALDAANAAIELDVVDQVDGRFVVRPEVRVTADGELLAKRAISARDGLQVEVTQGTATVEIDPFNDATLVVPSGPTPAAGHGVLPATHRGQAVTLVGQERDLGFDVANVPDSQLAFNRAGGGACAASGPEPAIGEAFEFQLRVRAAMPSAVIPLAPDRREIRWRHALYFAHDPRMGWMRLRPNPDLPSRTLMRSKSHGLVDPADFFPVRGRNELYFVMEMLDLGMTWFNKEPMVQSFDGVGWPPYDVPLDIDEPVEFYDVDQPGELRLTIHKNEMQIYDYQGVEIELLSSNIADDGMLTSRWQIRNQCDEPIRARWFALGNVELESGHPDQGNRLLAKAGARGDSYVVDYTARVKPSSLTQFVAMNVVSTDPDRVVLGTSQMTFHFPTLH